MNRSILISIKPEWVEKILNGEKTIEVRKTMPKCELPIDVYIYCCKTKPYLMVGKSNTKTYLDNGGEDSIYSPNHNYIGNGKVVAKFTLNKVSYTSVTVKYGQNITHEYFKDIDIYIPFEEILPKTCLFEEELVNYEYTNNKFGVFAWHIDNLQIFDKPIQLNKFNKSTWEEILDTRPCINCEYNGDDCKSCQLLKLNKAPQSWCYVYIDK